MAAKLRKVTANKWLKSDCYLLRASQRLSRALRIIRDLRIFMNKTDFPEGTEFYIKEFDVPLAHIPGKGWLNFFGGNPHAYNVEGLKPGNNWPADSFGEWLRVVEESKS